MKIKKSPMTIIALMLLLALVLEIVFYVYSARKEDPIRQVSVIVYGSDASRWENLKQGAELAAEDLNAEFGEETAVYYAGDITSEDALKAAQKETGPEVIRCDLLEDAVKAAGEKCREGDVVLLSPGCTSYDAFTNFEERGDKFSEWVKALA